MWRKLIHFSFKNVFFLSFYVKYFLLLQYCTIISTVYRVVGFLSRVGSYGICVEAAVSDDPLLAFSTVGSRNWTKVGLLSAGGILGSGKPGCQDAPSHHIFLDFDGSHFLMPIIRICWDASYAVLLKLNFRYCTVIKQEDLLPFFSDSGIPMGGSLDLQMYDARILELNSKFITYVETDVPRAKLNPRIR